MATATVEPPLPGPEEYALDAAPLLIQTPDQDPNQGQNRAETLWTWTPMWYRPCHFRPSEFDAVMQNLVRNPNVLSSWLFRADVVAETTQAVTAENGPALPCFDGLMRADERTLVRRLIPRNTMRDKPMLQTCVFYESLSRRADDDDDDDERGRHGDTEVDGAAMDTDGDGPVERSLVVYLPHTTDLAEVPFYHPKVQGVGFLHEWRPMVGRGTVSMHFSFFGEAAVANAPAALASKLSRPILARVALSLINTVCKHGEGKRAGYVKRVHHDQLVPQASVQDRYTRLKEKYARRLVQTWQETTDPAKHVFEDLSIAAFLMELWKDMYGPTEEKQKNKGSSGDKKESVDEVPEAFPGFIDVGCGNGLLVHILNAEGYKGWGFDARKRRSWQQYGNGGDQTAAAAQPPESEDLPLRENLLLPHFLTQNNTHEDEQEQARESSIDDNEEGRSRKRLKGPTIHDGTFPAGAFLIANHADELTVWTPLLAALAGCTFLAIPCCSHNFTGARFRAPPPSSAAKEATASVSVTLASSSTYASFVEWVASVAEDCGWKVELEMLRIPSTRNVGIVGRTRTSSATPFTIEQAMQVISKYGGAHGFADNVAKLAAEGKKSSH
ncbi:tRNA(Ser) Um(44) 2'-O-methyltransferase [Sporothrix curviconia]|uniref:tRNA (uracil-O(2)-)-methyltransferase n=1 Tax=Sporothrix curviconia TaxID=1260050 RepID=A0ABP0CU85_9PEZI